MRYTVLFLAAIVVAAFGCSGNGIVLPGSGDIVVTTETTGIEVDADGYWVRLDGSAEIGIGATDTLIFADVYEGEHAVTLSGLAANCGMAGSNPQRVTMSPGSVERISFNVNCVQAGQLAVTTSTSGDSIDFEYTVNLVGMGTRIAASSGTVGFETLMPGDYTVKLEDVSVNCAVNGDNPRVVAVSGGATAETTFGVSCTPALLDRIVFASERDGNSEIYSMTDRGTDLLRLTDDPAVDVSPAISPDGTRIAFTSDRDGDFDVYVMNIDGSGVMRLTNAAAYDGDPTWSPDGQRIAFVSERDGDPEIYVMNGNSTGQTNLTNDGSTDRSPAWSADGARIAFSSDRLDGSKICVMDADGSRLRILTGSTGADVSPTWSPDGKMIAFASDREGDWEVYALEVDTRHTFRVTNELGRDIAPAWSPDGSKIAVATDRDGDFEIYYHYLGIQRAAKLTDDSAVDTSPAWSPER